MRSIGSFKIKITQENNKLLFRRVTAEGMRQLEEIDSLAQLAFDFRTKSVLNLVLLMEKRQFCLELNDIR